MTQRLPSDTLKKPTRRLPWILGLAGAAVIATGAVLAGPSIASNLNPAPTPTPTIEKYVSPPLDQGELASVQSGADQQHAIISAEQAAAKAARDAAAAKAARDAEVQGSESAGLPSGALVPFIASNDPQNAAGGTYDTNACASHSASTGSDGKPHCD
jgi:hypothetical protein